MKTGADLVRGWLLKARGDPANAQLCLAAGEALDTEKLVELCAQRDASFVDIKAMAQELTPYAVQLRYDLEFWPSANVARQALEAALQIRDFVLGRLPAGIRPG